MYNYLLGGLPTDYEKDASKKHLPSSQKHRPSPSVTTGETYQNEDHFPPPQHHVNSQPDMNNSYPYHEHTRMGSHDPINRQSKPMSSSTLTSSHIQLSSSTPQSQQHSKTNMQSFIPSNLQQYFELQYLSSLQTRPSQSSQASIPHRVLRSLQHHPKLTAEKKKKMRDKFFAAVERGDRNAVYHMVMSCNNVFGDSFDLVNSPNDHGIVPLIVAANAGRYAVLRLLCELGANVLTCDRRGCSALYYAVFHNHYSIAKFLWAMSRGGSTVDIYGKTLLMVAASKGHFSLVQLCLYYGENVNQVSSSQETALMMAVFSGSFAVVEYLIHCGANLDMTDIHGCTALLHALRTRRYDIAELLISKGASVDVSDKNQLGVFSLGLKQEHDISMAYDQFLQQQQQQHQSMDAHQMYHKLVPSATGRAQIQLPAQGIPGDSSNVSDIPPSSSQSTDPFFQAPPSLDDVLREHRLNVTRCLQNGLDRRIHNVSRISRYVYHPDFQSQLIESLYTIATGKAHDPSRAFLHTEKDELYSQGSEEDDIHSLSLARQASRHSDFDENGSQPSMSINVPVFGLSTTAHPSSHDPTADDMQEMNQLVIKSTRDRKKKAPRRVVPK